MKKIIISFLIFVMCVSFSVSYAEYTPTEKEITVTYNGENVDFGGASVQNIDGYTMVPMRAVFELAGCTVSFDGGKKEVVAEKENYKLLLTIDSKEAVVTKDGVTQKKQLDIAPCIISDRTLVPVRFISESLGFTVNWNPSFKEVVIIDFESWKKRLQNSAFGEIAFASFEKKDVYGGSLETEVDFETLSNLIAAEESFSSQTKQYSLSMLVDKNFDVYLKSASISVVLEKYVDTETLRKIKDKYVKIPVSHLLMSQMGIKLPEKDTLWEAIVSALSDDEYVYSSTVKNFDDIISMLECVKVKEKSKFIISRSAVIPQNSRMVEIGEIF